MNTQTIETPVLPASRPDVAKCVNTNNLFLSLGLFLLGILILYFALQFEDNTSALSMLLMVTGTALLFFSVFRFFMKSKKTVYLPTKSEIKKSSLFFDPVYLDTLSEMLKSGNFIQDKTVPGLHSGNIRMDMRVSRDKKFARVQLFRYIPYTYSAVSPVFYFTGESAESFCAFLKAAKQPA